MNFALKEWHGLGLLKARAPTLKGVVAINSTGVMLSNLKKFDAIHLRRNAIW